jgi:hypothetical protein
MDGTYHTNIWHYLDDKGEIITVPLPARKLASFLALIIESVPSTRSADCHDTGVRCRKRGCQGSIVSRLVKDTGTISWYCPACGHNGVIGDWQGTKWDRSRTRA